jgi:hypothetical protein
MLPLLIFLAAAIPQPSQATYQATMIRAAPGHLVDLIELLRSRMAVYQHAGEPVPVLMRHSQGDHWDLMLLTPIGTIGDHFSRHRLDRWRDAVRRSGFDDAGFADRLDRWVSWQEELYVEGPPVATVEAAAAAAGYFHLEIFQALAGMRDSLLRQRTMENDFLTRIGRPGNLIFRKVTGAAWDAFTIGFYRDLAHYAQPSGLPPEQENETAVQAGFASRADIGPYLRRFIGGHHDTLGSIVR